MSIVSILTSNSHKINQKDTNDFLSPLLSFTNDMAHSCAEQSCIILDTLVCTKHIIITTFKTENVFSFLEEGGGGGFVRLWYDPINFTSVLNFSMTYIPITLC
jgi:hypothetical protein